MTEIPSIKVLKVSTSSATIIIESTSTPTDEVKYKVGYLYMDAVSDSQCSIGCKTNNLTLEVGTTRFEHDYTVLGEHSQ